MWVCKIPPRFGKRVSLHYIESNGRQNGTMHLVAVDSDNGLSPVRRQAITSANAALLSLQTLGTRVQYTIAMIDGNAFNKKSSAQNLSNCATF